MEEKGKEETNIGTRNGTLLCFERLKIHDMNDIKSTQLFDLHYRADSSSVRHTIARRLFCPSKI